MFQGHTFRVIYTIVGQLRIVQTSVRSDFSGLSCFSCNNIAVGIDSVELAASTWLFVLCR